MGVALLVSLADDGADPEYVESATRRLREELLELAVDDVTLERAADAPEGARGTEAILLGRLLVSLPKSLATLRSVLASVSAWLARSQNSRSVRLVIDGDELFLSGVPSAEQKRLADLWVRAHGLE